VCSGTAGDAETFHHSLKTFALRDADNIDQLAFGESRYVDNVADFERWGVDQANFAEHARRIRQAGLGRVLFFRGGGVLRLLRGEADLNGVVAVGGRGLDLKRRRRGRPRPR